MKKWHYRDFHFVSEVVDFINERGFEPEDFKLVTSGLHKTISVIYLAEKP